MKVLFIFPVAVILLLSSCSSDSDNSSSSSPTFLWYIDADRDGYGDKNDQGTASTNQPLGYVDNNTDCDDTFDSGSSINIDAIELNTDQVDSDCDGKISKAPFIIGHYGPAGGIVYSTDGVSGLEVAPVDLNSGADIEWGCHGTEITGSLTRGVGSRNTPIISEQCETSAAAIAAAYELNGFNDWYLPAILELYDLYEQRSVLNLGSGYYWSSTQKDSDFAYGHIFKETTSVATFLTKSHHSIKARAIREF